MIDLITMIGHVSQSFLSLQRFVSGIAYLLGVLFIIIAIQKFRKIIDHKAAAPSHEKTFVPTAYLLGGATLLFLPSLYTVASNTVFGVGNILQFASYSAYDIIGSIKVIIRTAGIIWFIRGAVLLTHASEQGVQEGPKGLMYLIAGILAINVDNTLQFLSWVMSSLESLSLG